MREIKFRAWDKKSKKIREVNFIAFHNKRDAFSFNPSNTPKVIHLWGRSMIEDKDIILHREENYVILMQFTGLKDKYGADIYEGDIFADVLNTKDIGVVKFGEYNHCFDKQQLIDFGNHIGFYVEFNYKGTRKDLKYWAKNSEIIGNIYETPELLNK
jgi:uncharacterized phage protein (TIGR01671 family)